MAEDFKVIETQEQLNAVIGERLERAEKKHSEETAGLRKEIEALKKGKETDAAKIADLEKKNAEAETKVKTYETAAVKARIAKEYGIPDSLADRLRGATEDELKKDAESLKNAFPKTHAPLKSTSASDAAGSKNENSDAYAELARGLTFKD